MSVRVRLTRVGSKKNPIWRVVVADQRSPRDGRFIETIGRYNPQTDPSTIGIDEERLEHWLARGAQPTGAVKQLMKAQAKAGGPQVAGEDAETAAGAVAAEPAAAPEAAGSTAAAAAAPSGAPATPEPTAPEAAERAAAESAASEAAAHEPAAPAEGEPDSEAAERDS